MGGFVGRVLGDEAAGEGFFEDRLPQGRAPLQRGVDLPLVPLDHLELGVEEAHDLLLLGEATRAAFGFGDDAVGGRIVVVTWLCRGVFAATLVS